MKSSSVSRAVVFVVGGILAVIAGVVAAQQYPTRPLLIVAPFSAGGDSDLAARNLGAVIPKYLKQNAVVMNKVGASGAIGAEHAPGLASGAAPAYPNARRAAPSRPECSRRRRWARRSRHS